MYPSVEEYSWAIMRAREAEARRPSARQPSRRSAQSGLRSWLAGKLLRTVLLLDPAAHEAPRKAAANSGC